MYKIQLCASILAMNKKFKFLNNTFNTVKLIIWKCEGSRIVKATLQKNKGGEPALLISRLSSKLQQAGWRSLMLVAQVLSHRQPAAPSPSLTMLHHARGASHCPPLWMWPGQSDLSPESPKNTAEVTCRLSRAMLEAAWQRQPGSLGKTYSRVSHRWKLWLPGEWRSPN